MPVEECKIPLKSFIPTPVKTVRRRTTISPKTKKENCVICNKETKFSKDRIALFKGGIKTEFAKELEIQLEIVSDSERYPNSVCRNCRDKVLTLKKKKEDLQTSHKISKQQWALKCGETESQKRLFVSTSQFSSKRRAQSSLFSYD